MGQKRASVCVRLCLRVCVCVVCLFVVVPGCSSLLCSFLPPPRGGRLLDILAVVFSVEAMASMPVATPKALIRETSRRLRVE